MQAFASAPALPVTSPPPPKRARPRMAPYAVRQTLTVSLPRPLGLVLEEAGRLPKRVVVARVREGLPADGVVRPGDVVVATSATFGPHTWPARSLAGAVSAIKTRCGETVTLVLERDDGAVVEVAPPPARRAPARSRPLVGVEEREREEEPPVDAEVERLLEEFDAFRTRRCADALVEAATQCVRAAAAAPVPRVADVDALLRRLRRAEAPLTLRFYNNLMWSYVRARAPARAVDVFDDLPNPNVECYTTLAKALSLLRRPDAAVKLLGEMRARAVKPNVRTYNAIIAACLRGDCVEKALSLFEEMQANGISPDVVTWNTLIAWHARQRKGKERVAGAAKAFADMKAAGVHPNTITYTTIMKSYATSGAINKAEGIFAEMKKRFPVICVDTEAYNTLLTAHAIRLDWRRCLELLDEMQLSGERGGVQQSGEGFDEDEEDYGGGSAGGGGGGFARGGVARSLSSARNELSNDLFSAAANAEHPLLVEPNAMSYALVIKACADARRVEIAHTVFDEMLADGMSPPPPHAVVSLLGGYAASGDFVRAFDMLNRLKDWGIAPNLRMMCALMNACLNSQQPDLALAIYAKIKASSTRPDVVAYTMLLRAYGMEGDLAKAFNVVKAMAAARPAVPPNIVTYNALITCANEAGRPDAALRALQLALADGAVSINNNTFHAIVQRASIDSRRFYNHGELSTTADARYDSTDEGDMISFDDVDLSEASAAAPPPPAADVGAHIGEQTAREYLEYLVEAARIVRAAGAVPSGALYVALLEACETVGDGALGVQLVAQRRAGGFRVGRALAAEARLYEETMRSRDERSRVA